MTDTQHRIDLREADSRAYYDIAQLLESADDAEARVVHVLERLGSIVPYDQCALLQMLPGREPCLVTAPGTPPEARAELTVTTIALLKRLVDDRAHSSAVPSGAGAHLAVPLVGLDEILGVLFVRGGETAYEERHVRALSVVAAKLAAYLSLLHRFVHEAERTRELADARSAAEAADRAKDEFLALVSHELRTPLSSILAWTDALRANDISAVDRSRAVDAIERSVRAQAKLVAELLDLSCVSAATLRLDLRAVEPAKLIKEAILALQPQATEKAIHLDVSLDESVAPIVADPQRFHQIVVNLVTNAIKFTPGGGHVAIRLDRDGARARLQVADSGEGIRPEVLPKLFEPFTVSDGTTTRAHAGLGVGLALVKDLVELHGGQVRAESPGDKKGTVITVELPFGDGAPEVPATGARPPGERALAGIRVLVVDDDPDIGAVLQFVLESEGAIVTVTVSAAEALSALERSMPDVLLSDIAMPGTNGYDLMRQIVARKGKNAPPAAALSAYVPGRDVEEASASGFRMLLAKPIDPEALVASVAALARDAHVGNSGERREEGRLP